MAFIKSTNSAPFGLIYTGIRAVARLPKKRAAYHLRLYSRPIFNGGQVKIDAILLPIQEIDGHTMLSHPIQLSLWAIPSTAGRLTGEWTHQNGVT